MNNDFDEQFLYLTTIGRKTGLLREIWFVELNNRLYVLAEHGYKAQWLQNVIATRYGMLHRNASAPAMRSTDAEIRVLTDTVGGFWRGSQPYSCRSQRRPKISRA
jgi:hypothetical protein